MMRGFRLLPVRFRTAGPGVLAAVLLAGCGAPTVAPYMRPPAAPGDHRIEAPLAAAGSAWKILADPGRDADWPAAGEAYNEAVAAAFDDLRRAGSDWKKAAATTGTRLADPGPGDLDPALLGVVFPASKVDTRRLGERQLASGIGLPLVGWIEDELPLYDRARFPPPAGITATATAILRFDRGPTPVWQFRQPFNSELIRVGGVHHPLRSDWSAAHALYWEMSRLDRTTIQNVLLPQRLQRIEGIFFTRPPDPDRIPLVLVHGLKSSPDVFDRMINELIADGDIRSRYQLWVYSYPTGVPWGLAAARFRESFRAALAYAREEGCRHLDKTVVVAHSKGALITQASLRDPGDAVYSTFIKKPMDQLDVTPKERELLREVFLWEPLPCVRRAVFLAAPHRGSPLAEHSLAMLASRLIRLPKLLTVEIPDLLVRNAAALTDPDLVSAEESLRFRGRNIRLPTGIEALQPGRPLFQIVPNLPFRKGVHLHSVIGDRGRSDTPDSSDGVVPYWSSHLDGVDSELIVPSDHNVPKCPEAIQEVKRILLLNLREN
ncbi:esterase/lipase family protein [Haloferula sp. A504]|uniref:esterase/lipase family protein n=1 Tax=Haloferula sp. A504 TaxID=3373601 RepID=UPI0031CA0DC6|nr:hypothetical protein [Verrucomicrobiaceae bacterium E54]